ncbi:hypothetical protein KR018_004739 [Drosophila ironensis]|nr:hypothetical protein KR018_004739 [Drosophila ironensis]
MNATKSMFILGLVLLACVAFISADQIVGGVKQLEGDDRKEALDLLDSSLAQLAKGDGPGYKAVNVTSVTSQVVAGTLYTYNVELDNGSDKKECVVKIWSRPWLKEDGTNIKIKCGDDGEVERTW